MPLGANRATSVSVFPSMLTLQACQDHLVVILGLEVVKHMFDPSLLVDQKTDAIYAVERAPHELFRTPDAESFRYVVVFVRQEREVQQMLIFELLQLGHRIR